MLCYHFSAKKICQQPVELITFYSQLKYWSNGMTRYCYGRIDAVTCLPYRSHQAKIAFTFTIKWLDLASIQWLAPGTLSSSVMTRFT